MTFVACEYDRGGMTGSPIASGKIGNLTLYQLEDTMNQSPVLYDTSAALTLLDPWLRAHLPTLDAAVTRRFIQLVTGIFEQRSLLLETIAESTVFTGTDSSNVTQVRRIIRD